MATVAVWAPNARKVAVEAAGTRAPMVKDDTGWWTLETPSIEHGSDYALYVDGEGPFPDPRSPWQPEGVHGPSRWVDHGLFEWSDFGFQQPPLSSAVIYEMHVGTFTSVGTFEAVTQRLDYLIELGITHIELMPVAEFSGSRGWGYDGVALYAPHHVYGGPEGLKRLVNASHERGLAVLLDVVYNHLGPSGNYLGNFAPYFTNRYVTPWGKGVNLDGPESIEVRRFFIDNALMWLRDYHLDGLRIDAVHAIVDTSAIHFLEQLASEVKKLEASSGRHLVLIAENDLNDPRVVRAPQMGGYGLDAQWNEDFHHALYAALTGERSGYYADFGTLADIAKVMTRGFVYDGRYSKYRRRIHGRPVTGVSGNAFVGCLQNHDQVGNRAIGDRTSHLLSRGQLKIGAALVALGPFVPMLFQGEEWAASTPFLYFTGHEDRELGEAVQKGRQEEFAAFAWDPETIPDPQAEDTFKRSKLNWSELEQSHHKDILEWYRALLELRKCLPDLTDGDLSGLETEYDEEAGWFWLRRGSVRIICNFADTEQRIPCSEESGSEILLASEEGVQVEKGSVVPPRHAVVIMRSDRQIP
ncbi:MAG: malto-oligosyltrehalose trehalohydrolase [Candidatus Hydrogenedentes bacterium]|nr:malto-oligosyltrehalose trehalohydrolase [Candidatus Hydrogenedentota bacterium]